MRRSKLELLSFFSLPWLLRSDIVSWHRRSPPQLGQFSFPTELPFAYSLYNFLYKILDNDHLGSGINRIKNLIEPKYDYNINKRNSLLGLSVIFCACKQKNICVFLSNHCPKVFWELKRAMPDFPVGNYEICGEICLAAFLTDGKTVCFVVVVVVVFSSFFMFVILLLFFLFFFFFALWHAKRRWK